MKHRNTLCVLAPLCILSGGSHAAPAAKAPKAVLPLVIYDEGSRTTVPYIPSGYEGNTTAIKMDTRCPVRPHSGKTCLKVDYTARQGWGGVVWQNPANDWGSKPGGWNLTGAKKLTFWARGEKGGEVVSFGFGVLGSRVPFPDTATGNLEKVKLTNTWRSYTINLSGRNLARIKTGFDWIVADTGRPVTFYLDDIRYQ